MRLVSCWRGVGAAAGPPCSDPVRDLVPKGGDFDRPSKDLVEVDLCDHSGMLAGPAFIVMLLTLAVARLSGNFLAAMATGVAAIALLRLI